MVFCFRGLGWLTKFAYVLPMISKAQRKPKSYRYYVIGDIHGRVDLLDALMKEILKDASTLPLQGCVLVFLGDYIDRGMDSKDVIDYVLHKLPPPIKRVFLRGNHEDCLLRFLDGALDVTSIWFKQGGIATLASYGVNPYRANVREELPELRKKLAEKLPKEHLDFLTATRISWAQNPYFFVHAGIRPHVPLDKQDAEDCMWIRDAFLSSTAKHGRVIVHGHSITPKPEVLPNRIGIDTGAFATGHLTCLVLEGATHRFLST